MQLRLYQSQVGGISVPAVTSTATTGTSLVTKLITQWNYDVAGNTLSMIERPTTGLARAEFHIYDDLNRHVAQISPREGVTSFTYDAAGNMTSLRDPVQNVTEWTFDRRNRLTADTITLTETDSTNNSTGDIIQRRRLFAYDDLERGSPSKKSGTQGTCSLAAQRQEAFLQIFPLHPVGYLCCAHWNKFQCKPLTTPPPARRKMSLPHG
ncbi:MAG: RHS repeat domain-containing protein [Pirellulales bacterium]|nr:RHS repeat domain-containing protein [Pirellulales bacterium]